MSNSDGKQPDNPPEAVFILKISTFGCVLLPHIGLSHHTRIWLPLGTQTYAVNDQTDSSHI
ncbi:MAG: hypothetical protein ACKORE_00225, partial [Bacteroidota bacterium]